LRPDVPPGLERLLAAMLEKSRGARPESAAKVRAELSALAVVEGNRAALPPTPASTSGNKRSGGGDVEQRVVSVVLAKPGRGLVAVDTSLLAETQPSDEAEVVWSRVFSLPPLQASVGPHEGRVDALIDGSLLVTLSPGRTPKEQATNAARCALALEAFLRDAGDGAQSSIVVGTGQAVLRSESAIGQVIESCARRLSEGRPGIWLDDATATFVAGRFETEERPEGLRLVAERDDLGIGLLLGKPSPCVGRERDLDVLTSYFRECTDDAVTRVLLVTGPAGQGKTRLAHEFLHRLAAGPVDVQRIIARADPVRSGSSFGMLGPALRGAAQVDAETTPEGQRARVRGFFGRHWADAKALRVAA
jgi:hypothetical protein